MTEAAPMVVELVRSSPFEVIHGDLYSFRTGHTGIRNAFAITRDETEVTIIASAHLSRAWTQLNGLPVLPV
jgi:hypothetical protein